MGSKLLFTSTWLDSNNKHVTDASQSTNSNCSNWGWKLLKACDSQTQIGSISPWPWMLWAQSRVIWWFCGISGSLGKKHIFSGWHQRGSLWRWDLSPCSHYMRLSADGGFLTHLCVFLGCIAKVISLGQHYLHNAIWLDDGSVAAWKVEHFSTFDAGHGAEATDGPTMHFACIVNEICRRTHYLSHSGVSTCKKKRWG